MEEKREKIEAELHLWKNQLYMSEKQVEESLGRFSWTTAACPTAKPFMQPMWAWKKIVTKSGGRASKMAAWSAAFIEKMLKEPFRPTIWSNTRSRWHGASDAGASGPDDADRNAGIGGWYTDIERPEKHEVKWFHADLLEDHNKWLYADKDPQRRIAALELLGSLILFKLVCSAAMASDEGRVDMIFEITTDNAGNETCMLKQNCKTWPMSAIMMQMVWDAHKSGAVLGAIHKHRERNKWADQLAGGNYEGFDASRRITVNTRPEAFDMMGPLSQLPAPESKSKKKKDKKRSERGLSDTKK